MRGANGTPPIRFGEWVRVEEGTSGAVDPVIFRERAGEAALKGRRCFGGVGPGELVLQGGTELPHGRLAQ